MASTLKLAAGAPASCVGFWQPEEEKENPHSISAESALFKNIPLEIPYNTSAHIQWTETNHMIITSCRGS
jgi:hypothetical protein